jgi:hypothetical protein
VGNPQIQFGAILDKMDSINSSGVPQYTAVGNYCPYLSNPNTTIPAWSSPIRSTTPEIENIKTLQHLFKCQHDKNLLFRIIRDIFSLSHTLSLSYDYICCISFPHTLDFVVHGFRAGGAEMNSHP